MQYNSNGNKLFSRYLWIIEWKYRNVQDLSLQNCGQMWPLFQVPRTLYEFSNF